jgi:hypothetical protein
MNAKKLVLATAAMAVTLASSAHRMAAQPETPDKAKIKHVLLLSIDGMHAVDFYNYAHGIAGANGGNPYCPNLASLGQTGVNYVATTSSKPSDSFPGLAALVTGGSPRTTGLYYDVAYDRSLDAPTITTGTGLAGGPCAPFAALAGTTTDFDQGIEYDDTKLNGGAPGAALTEGGVASIDPRKLVRDPQAGCAPVYPWNFVRTNTIFNVVHAAGGYTAWIDKHASYSFVAGPGGKGLDDYYSPEVDSTVVALPELGSQMVALLRSIPSGLCVTPKPAARPSTPGTSSAPTQSSASSTALAAIRPGLTNTQPILQLRAPGQLAGRFLCARDQLYGRWFARRQHP